MAHTLPTSTKSLVIQESNVKKDSTYHDAVLTERPLAAPKPGEVVIKVGAVGFNHKDVRVLKLDNINYI